MVKLSKYKLRHVIDQAKKSVNYQSKTERSPRHSKQSSSPVERENPLSKKHFLKRGLHITSLQILY